MDEWNKANKIGKDICDQIVSTYPQNAEAKKLKAIIISVSANDLRFCHVNSNTKRIQLM